jgi:hypothetical protein
MVVASGSGSGRKSPSTRTSSPSVDGTPSIAKSANARHAPPAGRTRLVRQVPPSDMSGCRCWNPVRSRRTTIRCIRRSCSSSNDVIGWPSGPTIVNAKSTFSPAATSVDSASNRRSPSALAKPRTCGRSAGACSAWAPGVASGPCRACARGPLGSMPALYRGDGIRTCRVASWSRPRRTRRALRCLVGTPGRWYGRPGAEARPHRPAGGAGCAARHPARDADVRGFDVPGMHPRRGVERNVRSAARLGRPSRTTSRIARTRGSLPPTRARVGRRARAATALLLLGLPRRRPRRLAS